MTTGAITTKQEAARSPGGYLGHDLIFVISQPRSGSTLLQRMLAGHSWIQTSAETWLMLHPAYGLRREGITTDYRAGWAVGAVEEFLDHYADGRNTWLEAVRAYAQTVYGAALARGGKQRFLDKTPRYSLIVPELVEIFPEARILLLIRNPVGVLSSELRTYIRGDWPRLADFAPDLLEAPARLAAAKATFGHRMLELHYEQLVTDPGGELKRICRYLGLPWEPGLEDYSGTPAPRGRANDPVGVHRHQRPSKDSLETWRELGRTRQTRSYALAYLEALGSETIAALGYDADALRAGIEEQPLQDSRARVFPWRTAVRHVSNWSLRERAVAAWYFAAEERGAVAGVLAAGGEILARIKGTLLRLVGRTSSKQRRPGLRDDFGHDRD